ncbi:MAG: hypothetical protein LBQ27_01190, partial [Clostridiales bacterium]|nr:hypothetical protein [Clostridiales bacterium]
MNNLKRSFKKRAKGVLLAAAFIFVLTAFSFGTFSYVDPTGAAALGGGDGSTYENAIEISSAAQLKTLADNVNGGNTYEGKYIKLMDDIDLSAYGAAFDGGMGWTLIGNTLNSFDGLFDGNNHTVSNLYINHPNEESIGLFGFIGWSGEVKNLGITSGSVSDGLYVGGIAGYNYGTIENCYNTGDVSGNNYVGGIAGVNYDTIENCYNTGDV